VDEVKKNEPSRLLGGSLLLKFVQTARKPNFVLDDHSSRRRITAALQQPTRRFRHMACATHNALLPGRNGPLRDCRLKSGDGLPAYLVLLRVGFTVPQLLPVARWALTPPFHPYRRPLT